MYISLNHVSQVFPITNGQTVAVDDVSLTIQAGERVGIIGQNGAGKTTLLQVISGLTEATSGEVDVQGRVNCIMTLGVGLREELSGRENIYLDGELHGKAREKIDSVIDAVIEYTDIGKFIDYPVRTYSTGMKARLGFAMITYIEPEILIIDEALSAGDAQFSAKATVKMKEICAKGKILVVVSHGLGTIVDMCDRCIWMKQGRIEMDGDPQAVTNAYQAFMRGVEQTALEARYKDLIGGKSKSEDTIISQVAFFDHQQTQSLLFNSDETMTIRITIRSSVQVTEPDLGVTFERFDGIIVMENKASADGEILSEIQGEVSFDVEVGEIALGQNDYLVKVALTDRSQPIDNGFLASYLSVVKIEQPQDVCGYPSYFSPIEWVFEPI